MSGDSASAAVGFTERDSMRSTKTVADGRFEIPDAVEDAVVIAELGDRRSSPEMVTNDVTLQLAPTSRLEGHVDLASEPPTRVVVAVRNPAWPPAIRYELVAPVASDGSFTIDGVPRHEVRVFARIDGLNQSLLSGTNIAVRDPIVRGIALSLAKSARVVHVIVRNTISTKLANAEIVVLPGKVPSMSFQAMKRQFRGGSVRLARQLEGEHAPKQIIAATQPGDLFATMTDVPDGVASACAFDLPELSNEDLMHKLNAHLDKLQVICTQIPDDAKLVTIEVIPFPRLD